jgi:hypothetical protein
MRPRRPHLHVCYLIGLIGVLATADGTTTTIEDTMWETFGGLWLSLEGARYGVPWPLGLSPVAAARELRIIMPDVELYFDVSVGDTDKAFEGKACFAMGCSNAEAVEAFDSYKDSDEGRATRLRYVGVVESVADGAVISRTLVLLTGAAKASSRLKMEPITLEEMHSVYYTGVDQIYTEGGPNAVGTRCLIFALGALRADKPRAIRACDYQGYRVDLYFRKTEVAERAEWLTTLAIPRRSVLPQDRDGRACRVAHHARRRGPRGGRMIGG